MVYSGIIVASMKVSNVELQSVTGRVLSGVTNFRARTL